MSDSSPPNGNLKCRWPIDLHVDSPATLVSAVTSALIRVSNDTRTTTGFDEFHLGRWLVEETLQNGEDVALRFTLHKQSVPWHSFSAIWRGDEEELTRQLADKLQDADEWLQWPSRNGRILTARLNDGMAVWEQSGTAVSRIGDLHSCV